MRRTPSSEKLGSPDEGKKDNEFSDGPSPRQKRGESAARKRDDAPHLKVLLGHPYHTHLDPVRQFEVKLGVADSGTVGSVSIISKGLAQRTAGRGGGRNSFS